MERRRALRVLRAVCGSTASLLGPVQALKALEDAAEPRLVADALSQLGPLATHKRQRRACDGHGQ